MCFFSIAFEMMLHDESVSVMSCPSTAVRECACVFETERELGIKSRRQCMCPELNGLLQVDGSVINIPDSS